jgi:hypothetical protein
MREKGALNDEKEVNGIISVCVGEESYYDPDADLEWFLAKTKNARIPEVRALKLWDQLSALENKEDLARKLVLSVLAKEEFEGLWERTEETERMETE